MKLKKWRLGAILLSAVILAGAVTGASFAVTDQTNNSPMEEMYQSFISKFAANLGVGEDELTAALDETKRQMLDEAVAEGKITQEQAERISTKTEEGFYFRFGGFHGGPVPGKQGVIGFSRNLDNMAGILGVTADELKAEIESGKTLQDIVAGYGLTMEQYQAKMLEIKKTEISQAVADGRMTQEQADHMLEKMALTAECQGFKMRGPGGRGFGIHGPAGPDGKR